jgi:hypothetical protein
LLDPLLDRGVSARGSLLDDVMVALVCPLMVLTRTEGSACDQQRQQECKQGGDPRGPPHNPLLSKIT